jgi:hypothetical protein
MFREFIAGGCLAATLGCGREPPVEDARARALRHGESAASLDALDARDARDALDARPRAGARFAGLGGAGTNDGSDPRDANGPSAETGAHVRVTLIRAQPPRAARAGRDDAPIEEGVLAEESISLQGTRRDGSPLTSFRRNRDEYELSGLRDDGEMVWLRALDAEAEDGAPPLALIGLSRGVLDDTRALRVAIEAALPKAGRARVVARVLDGNGAPRAHVRAYPLPGTAGPRVDDERGELRAGGATGARGVIVYDDVDPSRQALTIPLSTARGRTTWVARVLPDVTTTLLIELDDD